MDCELWMSSYANLVSRISSPWTPEELCLPRNCADLAYFILFTSPSHSSRCPMTSIVHVCFPITELDFPELFPRYDPSLDRKVGHPYHSSLDLIKRSSLVSSRNLLDPNRGVFTANTTRKRRSASVSLTPDLFHSRIQIQTPNVNGVETDMSVRSSNNKAIPRDRNGRVRKTIIFLLDSHVAL